MQFEGFSKRIVDGIWENYPAKFLITPNRFSFTATKYGDIVNASVDRRTHNTCTWASRTLSDDHNVIYDHMNNFTAVDTVSQFYHSIHNRLDNPTLLITVYDSQLNDNNVPFYFTAHMPTRIRGFRERHLQSIGACIYFPNDEGRELFRVLKMAFTYRY
jgi:hypothetical protein